MPIVQIELLTGRTLEQRRALAKNVTKAITDSLNVPPEAVSIIIREMEPDHYATAGELRSDRQAKK